MSDNGKKYIFNGSVGAVDSEIHGNIVVGLKQFDHKAFEQVLTQITSVANEQEDFLKIEILKKVEQLKKEVSESSPSKKKIYEILDWTNKITAISNFGITLWKLIIPLLEELPIP